MKRIDTACVNHEDRDMRNVTISLDDETARAVRVRAAECDMSVSRYVADLLRKDVTSEASERPEVHREELVMDDHYRAAMAEFFSIGPLRLREPGEKWPTREEMHERRP